MGYVVVILLLVAVVAVIAWNSGNGGKPGASTGARPVVASPSVQRERQSVGEANYYQKRLPLPANTRKREGGAVVAVVGESNYKANIREVLGGSKVGGPASGPTPVRTAYLFRESNNPYDEGVAVLVTAPTPHNDLVRIGYIASKNARAWHPIIGGAARSGAVVTCDVTFYRRSTGKGPGTGSIEAQLRTKRP